MTKFSLLRCVFSVLSKCFSFSVALRPNKPASLISHLFFFPITCLFLFIEAHSLGLLQMDVGSEIWVMILCNPRISSLRFRVRSGPGATSAVVEACWSTDDLPRLPICCSHCWKNVFFLVLGRGSRRIISHHYPSRLGQTAPRLSGRDFQRAAGKVKDFGFTRGQWCLCREQVIWLR